MQLSKIEKCVLVLAFWTKAWSNGDAARWYDFAKAREPSEEHVIQILKEILDGVDDVTLEVPALWAVAAELEESKQSELPVTPAILTEDVEGESNGIDENTTP